MRKFTHSFIGLVIITSAFLGMPFQSDAAYGDVTTYAGSIYGGDGVSRLNAYFDFPQDIARDTSGNFYVADTYNNVVRKISSGGTVSTLAGTGSYGDATGSAASAAQFALPQGVAWGSDGSVYVADSANGKVKKIKSGSVSTIATGLSDPHGVTPYGSTVYIADSGNNAIKKVSTSGGTVTTLTSGVSDPRYMAVSDDGSTLYVADNGNHRVVAVNTSSGAVSVIAGSGTSGYVEGTYTTAQFENVWGMALSGGYLYVSDHDNWTVDRIRKINLSTKRTSLIYQDTRQNELIYPSGLVVTGGYVYAVNAGLGTIHKFNVNDGDDNALFAGAERFGNKNGSVDEALFGRPYGTVITSDGNTMYVADNNKIRKINLTTDTVSHVIGSSVDNYRGEGTDEDALPVRFSTIQSLTVNSTGTRLYVVDRWNNRIRGINLQADPVSSFLVSGAGLINTRGDDNNGYAEGDRCSEDVRTTGVSGCAYFRAPAGIAIDPTDTYLYVADTGNNRIRKVRISDGQTWLVAGSSAGFADGTGSATKFNRPWGVAIDPSGSNLYVADSNNHAIRKINLSTNVVTTLVGNGSSGYLEAIGTAARLSYPEYVTMDGSGNIFFSETGSQRIRLVEADTGLTKLVAGSGTRGYINGAKATAQFNNPKGMAVGSNVLYVADSWNDVIRSVNVTGSAPYTEPAPQVSSVSPGQVNPAWDKGDGLLVKVEGANFAHGVVAYVGNYEALKTYVQSSSSLAVQLPLSQMSPGWYDVTVIKPDGQMITLERALAITDSNGNVPDIYYEYSGKTASTIMGADASGPRLAQGSSFFVYASHLRGGYHVAAGNVKGTGEDEIIAGTDTGMGPQVRVFDSSGTLQAQFFAYDSVLRNGVTVSACDVDGDGYEEIVTAQGPGGWPIVKIFDGHGNIINDGFSVLDGKFTGGVNLSCGDTDGDGTSEIVVAAMQGGGPHVLVYNVDGRILTNFMAYDPNFRGGINVATLDMDGDGRDEIVTGPQFGAPHVQIFQIRPNELKRLSPGFYAFDSGYRGGVSVAGVDTDGNGVKELLVGVGENALSMVKVYNIREVLSKRFYTYASSFTGGLRLSGGDIDGDGADELLVIPRSGGGPNVRMINVDEVE